MRKLMLLCASLYAMAFVVGATPAQATNARSFVASNGNDSNACTQAAPCLTFTHALTQTAVGGEIDCLSGGDFGLVTLPQPSPSTAGPVRGVRSGHGFGRRLQRHRDQRHVVLRNLNINGFNGQTTNAGIAGGPSGTLIVQHCTIHGFSTAGIAFTPTSGRGQLEVSDTAIYGNFGPGITIEPSSGVIAFVVLNRVEINGMRGHGGD